MKRSPKDQKALKIDGNKARQAEYDRAVREHRKTKPPYLYTELCPVPELRRPPMRMELLRRRMWFRRVIEGGEAGGHKNNPKAPG